MPAEFWKSSGYHLVETNDDGWLKVTPDLIRAYLTRPEVHPVDESCATEIATFEALMEDVIDRARGMVKKEFNKAFRRVEWYRVGDGWQKRIKSTQG